LGGIGTFYTMGGHRCQRGCRGDVRRFSGERKKMIFQEKKNLSKKGGERV